ncbi:hypothetical protein CB1_025522023 [Camelus ferus]|nr:hypothetical protein CB1_025522023 [Camelus ferus]
MCKTEQKHFSEPPDGTEKAGSAPLRLPPQPCLASPLRLPGHTLLLPPRGARWARSGRLYVRAPYGHLLDVINAFGEELALRSCHGEAPADPHTDSDSECVTKGGGKCWPTGGRGGPGVSGYSAPGVLELAPACCFCKTLVIPVYG